MPRPTPRAICWNFGSVTTLDTSLKPVTATSLTVFMARLPKSVIFPIDRFVINDMLLVAVFKPSPTLENASPMSSKEKGAQRTSGKKSTRRRRKLVRYILPAKVCTR